MKGELKSLTESISFTQDEELNKTLAALEEKIESHKFLTSGLDISWNYQTLIGVWDL